MSVEPDPVPAPGIPEHEWNMPPIDGWTADDLDRLPNLPPHTELIDGSLVFVSPQSPFHTRAVSFFEWQLQSVVPHDLESCANSVSISTARTGPNQMFSW
jgi:hypothetical protein